MKWDNGTRLRLHLRPCSCSSQAQPTVSMPWLWSMSMRARWPSWIIISNWLTHGTRLTKQRSSTIDRSSPKIQMLCESSWLFWCRWSFLLPRKWKAIGRACWFRWRSSCSGHSKKLRAMHMYDVNLICEFSTRQSYKVWYRKTWAHCHLSLHSPALTIRSTWKPSTRLAPNHNPYLSYLNTRPTIYA